MGLGKIVHLYDWGTKHPPLSPRHSPQASQMQLSHFLLNWHALHFKVLPESQNFIECPTAFNDLCLWDHSKLNVSTSQVSIPLFSDNCLMSFQSIFPNSVVRFLKHRGTHFMSLVLTQCLVHTDSQQITTDHMIQIRCWVLYANFYMPRLSFLSLFQWGCLRFDVEVKWIDKTKKCR